MGVGRPTSVTKEVLRKLEHAFSMGCPDKEACFYAGISTQTLYDYQNKYPAFAERKEELKQNPFILARSTIIKNLSKADTARWFAERKLNSEFGEKKHIDLKVDDDISDDELNTIIRERGGEDIGAAATE